MLSHETFAGHIGLITLPIMPSLFCSFLKLSLQARRAAQILDSSSFVHKTHYL